MAYFFEAMRRGIEKRAATVGAKSKEVLEVSHLRRQIRGLEDDKKDKLEELGSIVHTMLIRGGLDEARLREESRAIAAVDAALKEKSVQIEAIRLRTQETIGRMEPAISGHCACGAALLAGSKFCGTCGAKVIQTELPQDGSRLVAGCAGCGGPLTVGTRFCGNCGEAVRSSS